MNTDLMRYEGPLDLASLRDMGDIFVKSGYFKDTRDAAQAIVKIMYGRELGFSPVIAMTGIHIIEGKPALSSNLLGAMVKRSGKYDYRVKVLTDTECLLSFSQDGQVSGESSFSMDDAKRANVLRPGSGWSKYPRNMLFARALSNGVKLYCPELSACPIYVPEELGADVNEEGNVTQLPKSAPPVEVIPEDIVIGSPARGSAEAQGKPSVKTSKQEAADVGPDAASPSHDEPSLDELATKEQQDYLRIHFKDALPASLRKHSDQLRRDWLAMKGYKDEKGVGTSKQIPRVLFKAVCKDALSHAKGLAIEAEPVAGMPPQ